jgi:hypothetical protein
MCMHAPVDARPPLFTSKQLQDKHTLDSRIAPFFLCCCEGGGRARTRAHAPPLQRRLGSGTPPTRPRRAPLCARGPWPRDATRATPQTPPPSRAQPRAPAAAASGAAAGRVCGGPWPSLRRAWLLLIMSQAARADRRTSPLQTKAKAGPRPQMPRQTASICRGFLPVFCDLCRTRRVPRPPSCLPIPKQAGLHRPRPATSTPTWVCGARRAAGRDAPPPTRPTAVGAQRRAGPDPTTERHTSKLAMPLGRTPPLVPQLQQQNAKAGDGPFAFVAPRKRRAGHPPIPPTRERRSRSLAPRLPCPKATPPAPPRAPLHPLRFIHQRRALPPQCAGAPPLVPAACSHWPDCGPETDGCYDCNSSGLPLIRLGAQRAQ